MLLLDIRHVIRTLTLPYPEACARTITELVEELLPPVLLFWDGSREYPTQPQSPHGIMLHGARSQAALDQILRFDRMLASMVKRGTRREELHRAVDIWRVLPSGQLRLSQCAELFSNTGWINYAIGMARVFDKGAGLGIPAFQYALKQTGVIDCETVLDRALVSYAEQYTPQTMPQSEVDAIFFAAIDLKELLDVWTNNAIPELVGRACCTKFAWIATFEMAPSDKTDAGYIEQVARGLLEEFLEGCRNSEEMVSRITKEFGSYGER